MLGNYAIAYPENHYLDLHGHMFIEELQKRTPPDYINLRPTFVAMNNGCPVVWHSCYPYCCDLCGVISMDNDSQPKHMRSEDHLNEVVRQAKWSHQCGICDIMTTSLSDFCKHVLSKKHRRTIRSLES